MQPPDARPPAGPPAIDREEMLERFEGDLEFIAEIVEQFEADAPALIDAVEQALAGRDADALLHAAHTLKGAAANVAARALAECAAGLEALGRQGTLEGGEAFLAALRERLAECRTALGALRRAPAEEPARGE